MDRELTPAIQDYLKAIYTLSETGEPATTNALAGRLGVAPASVTSMLQKLSGLNPPLVTYQKHQGVLLTEAGRLAALKVLRYHRLMELYLVKVLGFSWDEVHEEADRLEHVMSDHLVAHLAEALGNPLVDPHGDPIPSVDLQMRISPQTPLLRLREGQTARVERIGDDDPRLLRYLTEIGLIPGASLEVLEYVPFDQTLKLRIGEQDLVVGPAITSKVFVSSSIKA